MRNSDVNVSHLGTIAQSAFDRLNPADYPGAKVLVIGSGGTLTEYSSLGTAWKQVAPFTDAQVTATQSLVSGAYTGLWVNRPSSPALYDQIFVTDIGPNGASLWWNGTRWKVLFPTVIAENATILTGVAQLADQYLGGLGPIPAGLIQAGDVLSYHVGLGKNGATDAYGTVLSLRLGAGGVIADSAIVTANYSGVMVASARSAGVEKWFRFDSVTTTRGLGPNNANSSWNGLSITGAAPEATATVINVNTTPWYIGVSTTMGGATNAPQLTYQRLTLLP